MRSHRANRLNILRLSPAIGASIHRPACLVVQPHTQLTAKLHAYAATSSRLHLVDCSRIYLESDKRISKQLMPGGLHPSKAGEQVLFRQGLRAVVTTQESDTRPRQSDALMSHRMAFRPTTCTHALDR